MGEPARRASRSGSYAIYRRCVDCDGPAMTDVRGAKRCADCAVKRALAVEAMVPVAPRPTTWERVTAWARRWLARRW